LDAGAQIPNPPEETKSLTGVTYREKPGFRKVQALS